jgi:beta-lactamase class A
MKKFLLFVFVLVLFIIPAFSQLHNDSTLRSQLVQIARPLNGILGVSVRNIETGDTISYNGKARLVMQSVMKFPIALTVLHWVDTGKLSLTQIVHVTKHDLRKDTYSPLRDKYPKGTEITLGELLGYMISQSDNNACDILLGLISGPKTVQSYMLQLGIRGVAIRASEADMDMAPELQFANWCKPVEMTALLNLFYQDKILTKAATDTLYTMMVNTTTDPQRLKGLLPQGTVVAHKTGSSATTAGVTPGTNDVGIITLPNGNHVIVSAFVCNSASDDATRDGVIAKVAKAVYDFYNH